MTTNRVITGSLARGVGMNERSEYFAILAALCVTDQELSSSKVAEAAYQIWAAGNRICNEEGFTNGVSE